MTISSPVKKKAPLNFRKNSIFEEYLGSLGKAFPFNNKITLIHCPTFSFQSFSLEVAKNRAFYAYPPTGLQCLKAALSPLGLEVDILDLNFLMLDKARTSQSYDLNASLNAILVEYFEVHDVSVVGVSAGVTVSNIFQTQDHPFVQTLGFLKSKRKHMVLAGGIIATNEWKNILEKDLCHFVFEGEAENKLTYFFNRLMGKENSPEYSGIHFRCNTRLEETTGEKDVVKFEGDLISAYKNIHIEKYNKVGCLSPFSRMVGPEKTYSTLQLNRGCRAHCTFCGVTPFMGLGIRQYSIDSVISELLYLVNEREVTHFEWLDDDLLEDKPGIVNVLKKIRDLDLGITWAGNNGMIATSLDEDLLSLMVDSGCVGFRIGIESGNDEILRKIKKPASLKTLDKASSLLAKFPELFVVGCYIIGFENERFEQILDTFHLCLRMNLSWSGWSICQIIRDSNADQELEDSSSEYKSVSPFVPSKETKDGTIIFNSSSFQLENIFSMPKKAIPNQDELKEIWFAFNLITNYISNKNLTAQGSPKKFVAWVKVLQLGHPSNAVISLFLFIAYRLIEDHEAAEAQIQLTQSIVNESSYWHNRFMQYGLMKIVQSPSKDRSQAQKQLQSLRKQYEAIFSI
tara:strand:- start:310 stop:2193 length:1884 start_codon:yes stop_codon:yes gene_type:complete